MAAPQASSRLEMLQARFQQKQLQEKEQKLLQLYDQQQQRAYQVVQRGSAGSNGSTGSSHSSTVGHTVTRTSSSSHATSTSQGGKVRQMFDERRQTGGAKGIDRSYPLEPLENKPRKQQTNDAPGRKNGTFTIARQSVTVRAVRRVARADVNSNLNAGKPLSSYHEEITRDSSFSSPLQYPEDRDNFDNENYLARYASGDHRDANQVHIEETLDQETINRNRMMAKLHLMEYDESMKHRVRNDLESEEFPEELMVNVPDKLPKRTATKKLSQAEARLERFKNANAKRTTLTKTTTTPSTAVTKKRNETLYPASKSISREYGGAKNFSLKSSIAARKLGDTQSPSGGLKNFSDKSSRDRSGTSSPEMPPEKGGKTPSRDTEFFSLESDRSATTYSLKSADSAADSTRKVPSLTKDKNKDWEYIPENLKPFLSREPPTKSLPRQSKLDVATLTSKEKYKSNEPSETVGRKRNGHLEFFAKGNGRPATAIDLKPSQSRSRRTVASDVKSMGMKSRKDSKDSIGLSDSRTKYYCRETARGGTTVSLGSKIQSPKGAKKLDYKYSDTPRAFFRMSSSSEFGKTYSKRLEASPQFIGLASKRSATTVTVIPETIRKSRMGNGNEFNVKPTITRTNVERNARSKTSFVPRSGMSVSLKDMDDKRSRSVSPKFYSRESVKSNTAIDTNNIPSRSSSAGELIGKRESSPEFYYRESNKSVTAVSLKPRASNDNSWMDGCTKSPPRPFQQKATKDLGTKSDKNVVGRPYNRSSSTSLENSTLGYGNQPSRRESGHILNSIGLIRDVINREERSRKNNEQKTRYLKSEMDKKLPEPKTRRKSGIKIQDRPGTSESTRGTPILVPSSRSFTPTEVDTEIQEIILPHEYIERDKVADTKTSVSVATKKPILASSKTSLLAYSTSKSCKKEPPSTDRRSSSDSKSSLDHRRTVSLKQITRNKSDVERSRSPWPRRGSPSTDGANRRISRERSRPRGQTCSPPRSRNAESATESSCNAIFIRQPTPTPTPTEKDRRFRKSSPTRAAALPSSRRPAGEKSRGIDGIQALRSTDLVLKALSVNDVEGAGKMTKLGTRNAVISDRTTARPCYVAHRVTGPKLKDKQESSGRIGSVKSDLGRKRIPNDKAESKCTTRKTEDFHGERHKAVYSRSDDEKSRISSPPNNPYAAQSRAKDVVLLKTSQNENHRAVITSDTTGSSFTGIEGELPELIRKNTMEGNTAGKTRINDFVRTDSVESALKRFDSIGAESIPYETLSIAEVIPREERYLNPKAITSKENRTAKVGKRSRDKDEIGKRTRATISLTTLDRKRHAAHEKNMSYKPIPKRSPVDALESPKSKATATSSISRVSETSGGRSPKKFAKARDSMEIVRMSVKSKPAACKRKLFHETDSETESRIAKSKSKRTLTLRRQKPNRNDECSISTQQLHSIADIRESIDSASSSSRFTVTRREGETTPRSAIASKAKRLSTERKVESVRKKLAGLRDLSSKGRTALSRTAKTPSPEPAQRKATEPSRASRRSVPMSPSKSPDTDAPRMQDSKITRRSAAARGHESNGARRAVGKKSTDIVDGALVENRHQEQPIEDGSENHSQKPEDEAFVIGLDEQPTKEAESRKPPPPPQKKQSGEKLTSPTQPTRPASSISSSSNGSSNSQTSGTRTRMGSRAKTPAGGSAASKGQGSMKSALSSATPNNLVPCKMCGRRFAQDRVSLHEEICAKTAQKKRKQFDTVLYRVRGTELEPFVKKGMSKKPSEPKTKQPDAKSNWRRKHEDFINAIRSAKQVQAHLAAGGKLSDLPPPPASDTSDYIQCPHCARKFNQAAAERHIPKCEHMLHNKPAHSRAQKTKR